MTSAIMTSPDFGEICFLIALIIFIVAVLVDISRSTLAAYTGVLVSSGLALVALGWLAQ